MTKVQRRKKSEPAPEPKVPPIPEHEPNDPYLGQRHGRTVVGIDASLTGTAIALYDLDTGAYGVYRHRPKDKGVRRLLDIHDFVFQKVHVASLMSEELLHVCMEGYGFGGQKGHSIGEGGGAVKMALVKALGYTNRVAYPTLVAPGTLKKFVTGNGRAEKSDMKMVTFKRWGVEFSDDNECDAYGLAQVAALLADQGLREGQPQYRLDSLEKVNLHDEWPGD